MRPHIDTQNNNEVWGIYLLESNYTSIRWNTLENNADCWVESRSIGNVFENNTCRSGGIPSFTSLLSLFGLTLVIFFKSRNSWKGSDKELRFWNTDYLFFLFLILRKINKHITIMIVITMRIINHSISPRGFSSAGLFWQSLPSIMFPLLPDSSTMHTWFPCNVLLVIVL